MHVVLALPLLAALASARMQHVKRTGTADQHCRLAARLNDGSAAAADAGKNGTVAAAWFTGWNANYTTTDVDWSKYTHMTYAFGIPQNDGTVDLSLSGGEEGLKSFVAAAHNGSTKALLSIGGWTGSTYYSSAVGSAANRTAFVKALTGIANKFELDGLDFDYEYPVKGGTECNVYSPQDTANFLSFLQEMRQAVNSSFLLTSAAGVAPWKDATGSPSADVSAFSHVLDWVAIMNYDEYGQWSTTAGPNSALNDSCVAQPSQAAGSAVSAVKAWTAAGIPAGQLVLGMAAYGHAFNVSTSQAFAGSPNAADDCDAELEVYPAYSKWSLQPGEAQPTECGAPVAKDVQYTFAGLVAAGLLDKAGNATDAVDYRFDECSQTPVLYCEDLGTFVSFDDARAITAKGAFVKAEGLRGAAFWDASGDYDDILITAARTGMGMNATASSGSGSGSGY